MIKDNHGFNADGKKKERKKSKEEYLYASEPPPMKLTSQTSLRS